MQQHEEPEPLLGAAGEGGVDGELQQHVERRELCEAQEHDVLSVRGRGARVDAKGAERHQLRLEDAQVGEDREHDVAEHREVHEDHRHGGDEALHRELHLVVESG